MRWLQLEGVDPKQVIYVEIPMNRIRDALQAMQVEAAIVVEPFSDQIEQTKVGYMMADYNAALANHQSRRIRFGRCLNLISTRIPMSLRASARRCGRRSSGFARIPRKRG